MKGLFIILCLLLAAGINSKLYQVVAVIAPGARYHLNDLYDAKDYQNFWGEITPVGLRQQ
jgi:hypothetical protein